MGCWCCRLLLQLSPAAGHPAPHARTTSWLRRDSQLLWVPLAGTCPAKHRWPRAVSCDPGGLPTAEGHPRDSRVASWPHRLLMPGTRAASPAQIGCGHCAFSSPRGTGPGQPGRQLLHQCCSPGTECETGRCGSSPGLVLVCPADLFCLHTAPPGSPLPLYQVTLGLPHSSGAQQSTGASGRSYA